jgi:hypothetical protein
VLHPAIVKNRLKPACSKNKNQRKHTRTFLYHKHHVSKRQKGAENRQSKIMAELQ